jgi:phage baseplate assembly protein gpV
MKRTRFRVLAMLIVAGFCVAAMPAQADEWTKTYTITGKPDLRVETSDASIRVSTWDQNTIAARVTTSGYKIGQGGVRIEEHQTGDVVEIDVHQPHEFGVIINWGNHRRVEVEIQMPREGKVDLHTGDGNIKLTQFKGEMQLRSGDGSQELDEVDGKLSAKTGDGHIRVNGRFDQLNLKSGDGHVDARAAAGSVVAGEWTIESGDGSVTLAVPESLAADVDLHTGDGHIDLDLPVVVTAGAIRHSEVRGKINGGGNLLTIHTGDGSIRLGKS